MEAQYTVTIITSKNCCSYREIFIQGSGLNTKNRKRNGTHCFSQIYNPIKRVAHKCSKYNFLKGNAVFVFQLTRQLEEVKVELIVKGKMGFYF